MDKRIISVKDVVYRYNEGQEDEVEAIKSVSFDVFENDFIALCGHNGSGKSTIAKLLNGLFTPTKGEVEVFGINTRGKQLFDIRKNCGVVFQNPDNQMIASIIEDDIAFGPENIGLPSEEISQRVDWALKAVGMEGTRERTPFRLSGGQKQRIAIAGVLAIKPKILVLDEATAMLDPKGRREVLQVVQSLRQNENITVIMITHFMEEASLCDRVIIMDSGKIIADGGREVLLDEQLLNRANLEAPFGARVANALRANGVQVADTVLSIEGLVDELCP